MLLQLLAFLAINLADCQFHDRFLKISTNYQDLEDSSDFGKS